MSCACDYLNPDDFLKLYFAVMRKRSTDDTMNGMMEMSGMMQAPRDVIIKLESNPIIPAGKESQIKLLVFDKFTQKPMAGCYYMMDNHIDIGVVAPAR